MSARLTWSDDGVCGLCRGDGVGLHDLESGILTGDGLTSCGYFSRRLTCPCLQILGCGVVAGVICPFGTFGQIQIPVKKNDAVGSW